MPRLFSDQNLSKTCCIDWIGASLQLSILLRRFFYWSRIISGPIKTSGTHSLRLSPVRSRGEIELALPFPAAVAAGKAKPRLGPA